MRRADSAECYILFGALHCWPQIFGRIIAFIMAFQRVYVSINTQILIRPTSS
jgi:hypothetical protein